MKDHIPYKDILDFIESFPKGKEVLLPMVALHPGDSGYRKHLTVPKLIHLLRPYDIKLSEHPGASGWKVRFPEEGKEFCSEYLVDSLWSALMYKLTEKTK